MDLENVYGIGTKTMSLLNKLGINNISDLVNYCPFRWIKCHLLLIRVVN